MGIYRLTVILNALALLIVGVIHWLIITMVLTIITMLEPWGLLDSVFNITLVGVVLLALKLVMILNNPVVKLDRRLFAVTSVVMLIGASLPMTLLWYVSYDVPFIIILLSTVGLLVIHQQLNKLLYILSLSCRLVRHEYYFNA